MYIFLRSKLRNLWVLDERLFRVSSSFPWLYIDWGFQFLELVFFFFFFQFFGVCCSFCAQSRLTAKIIVDHIGVLILEQEYANKKILQIVYKMHMRLHPNHSLSLESIPQFTVNGLNSVSYAFCTYFVRFYCLQIISLNIVTCGSLLELSYSLEYGTCCIY